MAHLHKKVKHGKSYYYIREMARVNGKPKVVNQIYLGSIERIMEMAMGQEKTDLSKIQVQEFGSLFLANLIEKQIGVVEIIDSVIPPDPRDSGPSLGEFFLYAAFNRMIDPCSKHSLSDWLKNFAVHQIRPVDISSLTSQRYWQRWERVDQEAIEDIARALFKKVSQIAPDESDCFLFDTTNYFNYMDSKTSSQLAQRGRSKDGKNWLRQIGLALLVSRGAQLPLFYKEYEGNCHDSKLFNRLLENIFASLEDLGRGSASLTVVVDKGMNSEANMQAIDKQANVDFVTTYSPAFAEELVKTDLSLFTPVDTRKNRELAAKGRHDDQMVAWRTSGTYWGATRTVVVTNNPRTAAKQRYRFDKKLGKLQDGLFELRSRFRAGNKNLKSKEQVKARYKDLCESLYLPQNLYKIEFETANKQLKMFFRKDHYQINKHIKRFGKNIIITSHKDWDTDAIVQASLDRYQVENAFRQSKGNEFGNFRPVWHWTDGKIRCHLLACLIALTYLQLIAFQLKKAGVDYSVEQTMKTMRNLSSCLCWHKGKRKPARVLEEPNEEQAAILKVFGYQVSKGVLQGPSK